MNVLHDKEFLKVIKVMSFIVAFVFVLSNISLFQSADNTITQGSTMEIRGYLQLYNDAYDGNNQDTYNNLQNIITSLKNDESEIIKNEYFIYDKDNDKIISTTDINEDITSLLKSSTSEKTTLTDWKICKIFDFDHYKLLAGIDLQSYISVLFSFLSSYLSIWLFVYLSACLLLFFGHLVISKNERIRLVLSFAVTFGTVLAFSILAFSYQTNQLNIIENLEQQTLQSDLNYIYNESSVKNNLNKESLEKIGNSLARASMTLSEVSYVGDEANLIGTNSYKLEASRDVKISRNEKTIDDWIFNSYVQAGLFVLLVFILSKEKLFGSRPKLELVGKGDASLINYKNDRKIRRIILFIGIASSSFGIVNVLRIKQVVMASVTEDGAGVTSAIFTLTTVITLLSSLASPTYLHWCGNIKTYLIRLCTIGVVGSALCGISDNIITFVVGLLFYYLCRTTVRYVGDFYVSKIKNQLRKDWCNIEFNGADKIGQVIGSVAGSIVAVAFSYSLIQIIVSLIFIYIILYTFTLKKKYFLIENNKTDDGIVVTFINALKFIKRPSAIWYVLFFGSVGSISYAIVSFRLPLDIANMGYNVSLLSLITTLGSTVEISVRSLFHFFSKRVSTLTIAFIHRVAIGVLLLIYMTSDLSILLLIVYIVLQGFFDGSCFFAVTKAIRDNKDIKDISEEERIVSWGVYQKFFDMFAPTLVTAFSGPILPAGCIALPSIYWICNRVQKFKKSGIKK